MKTLKTLTLSIIALALVTTVTYALGTLTPQGTAGDNTHYTLNDIYNKISDFSYTPDEPSGTFTTPESVTASFYSLTEIYNLLANQPDLTPENIAQGATILGVEGTKEDGVVYPTQWSADHPDGYVDWETAMSYCENLEENSHTDWRLPSYIELVNAYLTGVSGFAYDYYWSSTEFPYSTGYAYGVNMGYGSAYSDDKTYPYYLARCAR